MLQLLRLSPEVAKCQICATFLVDFGSDTYCISSINFDKEFGWYVDNARWREAVKIDDPRIQGLYLVERN